MNVAKTKNAETSRSANNETVSAKAAAIVCRRKFPAFFSHKPWRNREAENLLNDKAAVKEILQAVSKTIFSEAKDFEHNAFKSNSENAPSFALRQAVEMKRDGDSQFHRTSTEPI